MARILLENAANVHQPIDNGLTPLHLAAMVNLNAKVIHLLLDYKANVDAKKKNTDACPLHLAAQFNSNAWVTHLLLQYQVM